jgi:putative membrane protein
MPIFARIAALAGLVLAIALIARYDYVELGKAVLSVGWGIIAIALLHLLQTLCSGLGWRRAIATSWNDRAGVFVLARLIRESVSNLLPVAHVGGDIVGARILTLRGAKPSVAAASLIVDLTLEVITQVVFTLMGLSALMIVHGNSELTRWAAVGLALGALGAAGFVLAQRFGLFQWIESLLEKMASHWNWEGLGKLNDLHANAVRLYKHRGNILAGGFYHLMSWMLGTVEIWAGLYFLGVNVALHEALIFESLAQAIRSAAFVVPGAIGVQEAGFIALGQLFGITPEISLALALVKRFREVLLGLPALLAWHYAEGRHPAWTAGIDGSRSR